MGRVQAQIISMIVKKKLSPFEKCRLLGRFALPLERDMIAGVS